MASLNLSTNGPSISKSYKSVVDAPAPSGPAATSPTYGQWALFAVSAPLVNAFQQDAGGKESTLKVQSTGGGMLRSQHTLELGLTMFKRANLWTWLTNFQMDGYNSHMSRSKIPTQAYPKVRSSHGAVKASQNAPRVTLPVTSQLCPSSFM